MSGSGRSAFAADASAGITTALVLVPQAIAYAMLAGLPAVSGLHAALVGVVVYAIVGRSAALAIGPVATDSLITAAALAAVAPLDPSHRLALAGVLALGVGAIQVLLGALRLGGLTNVLSLPVLLGFTSAAAVLVVAAQVPSILGLPRPPSRDLLPLLGHVAGQIRLVSVPTLVAFLGSFATLVVLEKLRPGWPRAPIVLALATLVAELVPGFREVARVGPLHRSVPMTALAMPTAPELVALAPYALTLAFVGYLEAHSIAKRFADRYGEPSPSSELVAIGASNLGAGLLGGFPITAGLGRSAVLVGAGGRTRAAGVVTASIVLLVIVLLAPVLTPIPRAALDAIVVASVLSLVDVEEMRAIARVKPIDATFMVVTAIATLVFSLHWGILVGIAISLVAFVHDSTKPHVAVLARIPGSCAYRSIARYPEAIPVPGMLLVRIDSQLYFGNATFLRTSMAELEARAGRVVAVVLDASGIGQLDSSAEAALARLAADYEARGIVFALASVRGPVRDVLRRSGLWERLGRGRLFLDVHSAVEALAEPEPTKRPAHALSPTI